MSGDSGLEAHVRAVREGRSTVEELFELLATSQVCLLNARRVNDGDPSTLEPLVLGTPGGFRAIAIFTSDQRAAPARARFHAYGYGVLTDFRLVVEGTDATLGITVNPGWPIGLDLDPATVDELARKYGLRGRS